MMPRKATAESQRAEKHWQWWKKMVTDATKVKEATLLMTEGDALAAYHAQYAVYERAMLREPAKPRIVRNVKETKPIRRR